MLVLPALARLLGPEGLGIYSIVFSLTQSTQGICGLGAELAMQRNGAQHETIGAESVGRLFGVGLFLISVTSAVAGLFVWIFRAQLAEHWLGQPKVSSWLGGAALLIVLQPLGTIPLLFLASLQDFRAYALRSSIGVVFGAVVTVALAWNYGLPGAIWGMILSAAAQIGWSYFIVKPVLNLKGIHLRLNDFWKEVRSILKLGFPYYYGNTLLPVLAVLPLMGLVSKYGGLGQLGYLRVAQSLASIIGFIPTAIAPAAMSYLSASWIRDTESYQYLRFVHLRTVWIMLLVFTGPVSLLLPSIIRVLYGTAYTQAYFLSWLCLWMYLLIGIVSMMVQYLVVAGKTLRTAWVSTLGTLSFAITALLLVPRFEVLGFMSAQIVGLLVSLPLVALPVISEMGKPERVRLRNLAILTLLSLLATLLITLAGLSQMANVILSITLVIVMTFLVFLTVLEAHEQSSLRQIVTGRVLRFI